MCGFSFILAWEPSSKLGEFYFGEAELLNFQADTWVDGRRSNTWDWQPDDTERFGPQSASLVVRLGVSIA